VLLRDALAAGHVVIDELSAAGSVPHVRATNRGEQAVLVLFGEELRGAKQNRIANASFLLAPRTETVIDVSCVEQGRWSTGRSFRAGAGVVSSKLRAKMADGVGKARASGHGFRSDQGLVWKEVQDRLDYARKDSLTSAYADYFDSRASEVEEICRAFHALPEQVGFVAMIGESVAGLEAIGRREVFARALPSLLRAYAIDAVDAALATHPLGGNAPSRSFDSPESFLGALAAAAISGAPSLGLGSDLRLHGDGVDGCALEAAEIVHLTAFAP
jgi:hypothetical protein